MKVKTILFQLLFAALVFAQSPADKFTEILSNQFVRTANNEKILAWVFFTDKGSAQNSWLHVPEQYLAPKSLQRRALRGMTGTLIDETDFPLAADYIRAVENTGVVIKQKSKWFNGISFFATKEQLLAIANLPFVKKLDIVYRLKKGTKVPQTQTATEFTETPKNIYAYDYGLSLTQMQQIKVPDVHNLGILGEGVTVGVMDAGFNLLAHEAFASMQIIATYDFVNHRIGVGDSTGLQGEGSHGTQTLSTIGGFKPGKLIGPAFKAKYILSKTENTDSETPIEEDNWIAAAEWADSIGVDVTSTSLGYIGFDAPYTSYTWQSMDGETCRITLAADLAALKGIVVVNSAGNEGSNTTHNTLGAPSDGKRVIAVGAVTSSGTRSYFSSVGNTVDGRIKPDVMAMGSSVRVASPYSSTGYTNSDGTSFSGPLAGGVAALIVCARPYLNPLQVREAMRMTASKATVPDREYGWGILNALNAINYFPAIAPPALVSPLNNAVVQTSGNTLVWRKVSTATGYKVQLSTNSAFTDLVINDSTLTDTTRAVPVLAMNTTYYWRVATKTASASSQYSSAAIFKTTAVSVTWQGQLAVKNAANETQSLIAGMAPSATDGIDASLNEATLPPTPPAGVFTAYFELPVTPVEFSYRDFRKDTNNTASYVIKFQAGDGGYPVTLSWNPNTLPSGSFMMKDLVTGTLVSVNMKTQSTCTISNSGITGVKIEYTKQICKDVAFASGWNIVSSPLTASDMSASVLFAGANSPAYGYNNGYTTAAQLQTGKGYWLRFAQSGNSSICGSSFGSSIPLAAGWNLIGAGEGDVAISSLSTTPAGIINSQFYAYTAGYSNATILGSGKGYWVRATQAGALLLNGSGAAKITIPSISANELISNLTITDKNGNSASLGLQNNAANNSNFMLPPAPPQGAFDCRFISGHSVATAQSLQTIQLQSALYPVSISVTGKPIHVTDAATNGKLFTAHVINGNTITISDPAIQAINVIASEAVMDYTLFKNYPNPFNPSTRISFSLPIAGKVTLKVYDVLGTEVASLHNGILDAGTHSFEFMAAQLASGIYICELRAGSKVMQNKMLLLK